MRETGTPYSTIALRLELGRAVDAHKAFIRAVRSSPEDEQRRLVANELERLEQLEHRITARDSGQPDKLKHRLLGVANLRDALP